MSLRSSPGRMRRYKREWARRNRPRRPEHALQALTPAELRDIVVALLDAYGGPEVARGWGVSATYLYQIRGRTRKTRTLRADTARDLEAYLARIRRRDLLVGKAA